MSHGLNTKYLQQAHRLCSAPDRMVEFGEVEEASAEGGRARGTSETYAWFPVPCTPLPSH